MKFINKSIDFIAQYTEFAIQYILVPFISAIIGGIVTLVGKIYFENWQTKKSQDKLLFKKIINILPARETQNFIDDVYNAQYHNTFRVNLDSYQEIKESPDTIFFTGKIEKAKEKFDNTFIELRHFLGRNFFCHHDFTNNGFFVLYEELRDSNPEEYQDKLEQLRGLVNDFDLAYKNFLRIAKNKHIS